MSLTASLKTALSGVKASQNAMSVVSENVNNVKTEGYSRKVYSQQTLILANGQSSGVISNTNLRQVDEQLRYQYRIESGTMQSSYVRSYYLDIIQAKMGKPDSQTSVSNRVNAIQTAFESLGVDSDKLNARSTTVSAIDTALSQIQALSDQIQAMRLEIDQSLNELSKEATDILTQLDKLNDDIVRTDAMNTTSADNYRDRRDTLITRLSEIMDIQTYERSTGETVILTAGGKPLLDKDAATVSHSPAASTGSLINYSSGGITGIYAGKYDITNEIGSGEMYGLIQLRDTELQDMQIEMDELAYQLTKSLNQVGNRGTNYPNMVYELTGTRTFINGGKDQTMSLSGGDVKIILFDENGKEAYSVSLVGELDFSSGTIEELTQTVQDWLQNAVDGPHLTTSSVGIDLDGHLKIDLGTGEYSIAFRDETSVLEGSDATQVSIAFDADANGTADRTFAGFSSFFGLNDLIISSANESVYDSDIVSAGSLIGIRGTTTLHFSDTQHGLNFGSVDVSATDTIKSIAEKINSTMVDESGNQTVRAEIVKEGSGYRLRIINQDGYQMELTETTQALPNGGQSGSVLERLGLQTSHAGYAAGLSIRSDVAKTPALLNTGKVQYSMESGEYYLSETDNSLSNDYAALFTGNIGFNAAGSFSKVSSTLSGYASSVVSGLATRLSDAKASYSYQSDLVSTLYKKEQEVSGVDLDEELSMMLMYERTYSAAAKVLSTTINLLEILDNIV